MGSIRRLDSNVDIQAFPGARFIINNEVPAAQCSEAKIEGNTAITTSAPDNDLYDPGKFTGYILAGKTCHITASVGGNIGDFPIIGNSNNYIEFNQDPGNGNPVTYYITDGGELVLTRDEASFAAFIHAAGYSYTFKGGRLFTDMPNGQLKNACTILWDPQT